jgi:transcriptional regulator with GAF, ATPase, and Fis domain
MGLLAQPEQETVSITDSPRRQGAACFARLVVVYPRMLAGVHALGAGEATIGRAARRPGSLALAHATVSREHASLRWDPTVSRHVLVDLGSHNGTWIEGGPVRSAPRFLMDQAVLRFGDVLAVYERQDHPHADAPEVATTAIPGSSLAACSLRVAIARAGRDASPALILGETGVGKESVAAELHRLSGRRGPLVAINCAALSPQLIESQLFGHTRGAFTGASQEHLGMFRAANAGTLFLDELGELPLELQPKLLRAVELGEVIAVGSTQAHRVDVRLIAATNRSLVADIEHGKFRRDLYARLALWELQVPPLRDRRADLIAWIDRLHRIWSTSRNGSGERPLEFEGAAAEALLLQPWPDNLRGLQRFVHECGATAREAPFTLAELGHWGRGHRPQDGAPAQPPTAVARPSEAAPTPTDAEAPARRYRRRPRSEELTATLIAHGWSIRATAKHYCCERKQITRWIERYAIAVHPGAATSERDDE